MNIIQIHNDYKIFGGETKVVKNEKRLLVEKGHKVLQFLDSNKRIDDFNALDKIKFIKNVFYSKESYNNLHNIIIKFKPDVIHIHNVFPLISPSVYYCAKDDNVPVVQTIHNFRFLCPNGLFLRNGQVCELCKNGNYTPAVRYGCYKNSYFFSGLYAAIIKYHRMHNTFYDKIDTLVALSEFSKRKLIEGGFDHRKIVVKPNFLLQSGIENNFNRKLDYFIFIGRLSKEKGIYNLVEAVRNFTKQKLKIIGNGEELEIIKNVINTNKLNNIELLGFIDGPRKYKLLTEAKALIFPSIWYENFPMTILEAYSMGTPVIASNIGSLPEIVQDKKTGLLFNSGDPEDLANKIEWAWNHPREMADMGKKALKEFELKYTAEKNYQMLMDIYLKAIENKSKR